MICGKCKQKISDIELYCKLCGADLQIFTSDKHTKTAVSENVQLPISDISKNIEKSAPELEFKSQPIAFEQPHFFPNNKDDAQFQSQQNKQNILNILEEQSQKEITTFKIEDELKKKPKEKPLYSRYFLDEEEEKK